MGKKKHKHAQKDLIWCWYCERTFKDVLTLVNHQKAKHYKCRVCFKKMSTCGGLVTHLVNVHKETITSLPNVIPGKETLELEIYGMEGVPEEDHIEFCSRKREKETQEQQQELYDAEEAAEEDSGEQPAKRQETETNLPTNLQQIPSFPMMIPPNGMPNYLVPPNGMPQFMPGVMPYIPILQTNNPAVQNNVIIQPFPISIHQVQLPTGPVSFSLAPKPPQTTPPSTISPAATTTTSTSSTTTTISPNLTANPTPTTAIPNGPAPKEVLVYSEESESMEERRASLGRYKYDNSKEKEKAQRLDQLFDSRLDGLFPPN